MDSSNPLEIKTGMEDLGQAQSNCPEHGQYISYGRRLNFTATKYYDLWSECPDCLEAEKAAQAKAVRDRKVAAEKAKWEELLGRTCLPKRFIGRSFNNYHCKTDKQRQALQTATNYAHQFEHHHQKGTGLLMMGMPGTGKSHLAAAILQEIMPEHVGIYVTFLELVRAVRSPWRKDSGLSEAEIINRFIQAPLLVIDEQGVQYKPEGSERVTLFDVIDGRYREMRPTIIITNQNEDDLIECVGERIYDRIAETCRVVLFQWPSYRPIAARELIHG